LLDEFPTARLATISGKHTGWRAPSLRIAIVLFLLAALPCCGQNNSGELRLHIGDPDGRGIRMNLHLSSEANQYNANLATTMQGNLDDFGGLFSGNAIGPPRSGMVRLTTTF
jgi:hypothetical protein